MTQSQRIAFESEVSDVDVCKDYLDGCLSLSTEHYHRDIYLRDITLIPLEKSPSSLSGRILLDQIDLSWIKMCLENCEKLHGKECYAHGWKSMVNDLNYSHFRVIDVQKGCLVSPEQGCRYVTLSYVWGNVKMLYTTRDNIGDLQRESYLFENQENIPRTISDAMFLVKSIGERYLWVDALCITQDDIDGKHSQLASMDAVYANSILTIIAASGRDANAGLPGLLKGTRSVYQPRVEYMPNQWLINGRPALYQVLPDSPWFQRGWTYQEHLLSKRCLIFVNDNVYFECHGITLCEDLDFGTWNGKSFHMREYTSGQRTMGQSHKYQYALTLHRIMNWFLYRRLVQEYYPRILSYESDVLNAFAGLGAIVNKSFRSPLASGLPETMIDIALLWRHSGFATRRSGNFPSWSWAGWKGGNISFDSVFCALRDYYAPLQRTKPLVSSFYRLYDDGQRIKIKRIGKLGIYYKDLFRNYIPPGWRQEKHRLDVMSDKSHVAWKTLTHYSHEDSPDQWHAFPATKGSTSEEVDTKWSKLVFSAASARFQVQLGNAEEEEDEWFYYILNSNSEKIGLAILDSLPKAFASNEYEFICLSETYTRDESVMEVEDPQAEEGESENDHPRKKVERAYQVLLVETVGGISYRNGIGFIRKRFWGPGNWIVKEIILG